MAFALLGPTVTQTGGTDATRDTPQGIIDAGFGTLTSTRTITMGNYHLLIDGFYEDTGWTYVFQTGKRMVAGGSCNWVSGYKTNDTYFGGATFNIAAVGSSDVAIANAGATLYWYDVTIDNKTYPTPNSRIRMNALNASSELVLTMKNPSYLFNNIGDIALFELKYYTAFIRHGAGLGGIDKFLHVSETTNSLYNNAFTGDIVYDQYQPVSLIDDPVHFYSIIGTKSLVLNNPTLNTDRLRIYNNGEVIRINQDLDIELSSNLTDKSGINVYAFTQDGSYQFPLTSVTDYDGKVVSRLLDVWSGSGNSNANYNVPNTISDKRAIVIAFAKYGLEYLTSTFDDVIGNGVFDVKVFRSSDTNITETDKTIVDAYTSLEPLDNINDRARSWKFDPANVEVPTIADQLFAANGSELILHNNWSLVLDNTATEVFAVNTATSTVTIKAASLEEGAKFKTLKAQGTGTITAANSEPLNVAISDANGDSSVTPTIPVGYAVDGFYDSAAHADAGGATGLLLAGGDGALRYQSAMLGGVSGFWRLVNSSDGSEATYAYTFPATAGAYSIQILTSALAASIAAIKAVVDTLPTAAGIRSELSPELTKIDENLDKPSSELSKEITNAALL